MQSIGRTTTSESADALNMGTPLTAKAEKDATGQAQPLETGLGALRNAGDDFARVEQQGHTSTEPVKGTEDEKKKSPEAAGAAQEGDRVCTKHAHADHKSCTGGVSSFNVYEHLLGDEGQHGWLDATAWTTGVPGRVLSGLTTCAGPEEAIKAVYERLETWDGRLPIYEVMAYPEVWTPRLNPATEFTATEAYRSGRRPAKKHIMVTNMVLEGMMFPSTLTTYMCEHGNKKARDWMQCSTCLTLPAEVVVVWVGGKIIVASMATWPARLYHQGVPAKDRGIVERPWQGPCGPYCSDVASCRFWSSEMLPCMPMAAKSAEEGVRTRTGLVAHWPALLSGYQDAPKPSGEVKVVNLVEQLTTAVNEHSEDFLVAGVPVTRTTMTMEVRDLRGTDWESMHDESAVVLVVHAPDWDQAVLLGATAKRLGVQSDMVVFAIDTVWSMRELSPEAVTAAGWSALCDRCATKPAERVRETDLAVIDAVIIAARRLRWESWLVPKLARPPVAEAKVGLTAAIVSHRATAATGRVRSTLQGMMGEIKTVVEVASFASVPIETDVVLHVVYGTGSNAGTVESSSSEMRGADKWVSRTIQFVAAADNSVKEDSLQRVAERTVGRATPLRENDDSLLVQVVQRAVSRAVGKVLAQGKAKAKKLQFAANISAGVGAAKAKGMAPGAEAAKVGASAGTAKVGAVAAKGSGLVAAGAGAPSDEAAAVAEARRVLEAQRKESEVRRKQEEAAAVHPKGRPTDGSVAGSGFVEFGRQLHEESFEPEAARVETPVMRGILKLPKASASGSGLPQPSVTASSSDGGQGPRVWGVGKAEGKEKGNATRRPISLAFGSGEEDEPDSREKVPLQFGSAPEQVPVCYVALLLADRRVYEGGQFGLCDVHVIGFIGVDQMTKVHHLKTELVGQFPGVQLLTMEGGGAILGADEMVWDHVRRLAFPFISVVYDGLPRDQIGLPEGFDATRSMEAEDVTKEPRQPGHLYHRDCADVRLLVHSDCELRSRRLLSRTGRHALPPGLTGGPTPSRVTVEANRYGQSAYATPMAAASLYQTPLTGFGTPVNEYAQARRTGVATPALNGGIGTPFGQRAGNWSNVEAIMERGDMSLSDKMATILETEPKAMAAFKMMRGQLKGLRFADTPGDHGGGTVIAGNDDQIKGKIDWLVSSPEYQALPPEIIMHTVVTSMEGGAGVTALRTTVAEWMCKAERRTWNAFMLACNRYLYADGLDPARTALETQHQGDMPAERFHERTSSNFKALLSRQIMPGGGAQTRLDPDTEYQIIMAVFKNLNNATYAIVTKDNGVVRMALDVRAGRLSFMQFWDALKGVFLGIPFLDELATLRGVRRPSGVSRSNNNRAVNLAEEVPDTDTGEEDGVCEGDGHVDHEGGVFVALGDAEVETLNALYLPAAMTGIYVAKEGNGQFVAPETALGSTEKTCWSCGKSGHLSNKCPDYDQNLPLAPPDVRRRLQRNYATGKLVTSTGKEHRAFPRFTARRFFTLDLSSA
jgi:hypothetical protein